LPPRPKFRAGLVTNRVRMVFLYRTAIVQTISVDFGGYLMQRNILHNCKENWDPVHSTGVIVRCRDEHCQIHAGADGSLQLCQSKGAPGKPSVPAIIGWGWHPAWGQRGKLPTAPYRRGTVRGPGTHYGMLGKRTLEVPTIYDGLLRGRTERGERWFGRIFVGEKKEKRDILVLLGSILA